MTASHRPSDELPSLHDAHWCVAAAWLPELEHLVATLPSRLRGHVLFATVGIGLVEAALGAARLIAEHRPAALLLVGTAGVYPGRRLPLGSAVMAGEMVLALPGTSAYLPELVPTRERSSAALTRALHGATRLAQADTACPLAITTDPEAAAAVAQRTGCTLENLECFAVARAAAHARIPFGAILGVANQVGPNGHRQWKQHGRRAAAAACDAALALLDALAERESSRAPGARKKR